MLSCKCQLPVFLCLHIVKKIKTHYYFLNGIFKENNTPIICRYFTRIPSSGITPCKVLVKQIYTISTFPFDISYTINPQTITALTMLEKHFILLLIQILIHNTHMHHLHFVRSINVCTQMRCLLFCEMSPQFAPSLSTSTIYHRHPHNPLQNIIRINTFSYNFFNIFTKSPIVYFISTSPTLPPIIHPSIQHILLFNKFF